MKRLIPPDCTISERVREWAEKRNVAKLDKHFAFFVLKARRRGYRYIDWDRAFMDAIRDDWANLSSAKEKPARIGWWSSQQASIAKGKELGLEARPGESDAQFRIRIRAKIEAERA